MGDKMRLVPFGELLVRMFEEYKTQKSLFDLPEDRWYRKADKRSLDIFGDSCATVLGPAAGPQTQLSQNIVSSYLTGSRFIELKTVQVLDALEIEKPCIDAYDEGFNTEWSTELSLQKAWEEYAKSWILLHIVEELWGFNPSETTRSFSFNMSVGYDLKGIKTEKMQTYLNRMMDSSKEEQFQGWLEEIEKIVPPLLEGTGLEGKIDKIITIKDRIPGKICSSVTLSTMHGCPPQEIEAICHYMIAEKGLDTFVKLNPTLLGYARVREILDVLGYDYVSLNSEGFEHDLQYEDALAILKRLRETAKKEGRLFGVKLTNTLASLNNREELPGDEMYMSGRALYPLSLNLASKLSEYFEGDLPISYSGGISIHNVREVFQTGIRPITLCTDLLKPGGYVRQTQMAEALEEIEEWDIKSIKVDVLKKLAASSLDDSTFHKDFRGNDEVRTAGPLPLYDCYVAPCITACAIHQHIPEYIRLIGQQRYAEALEVIYERNALPSMTGNICDNQCQLHCTRLDYEGCLNIREIKKIAVEQGMEGFLKTWEKPKVTRSSKCAVIGAGPAGLSTAYFLAREGFDVTVFEREADAGGVIRYVVPHFRITREAIESDVDHIRRQGVSFVFNCDEKININSLKAEGYTYITLGLGTYQTRQLPIEGDNTNILPSLKFLTEFNQNPQGMRLGKNVVVIGAGDTAMDCARSAKRCVGTEKVTVVYRRAFSQMPASREEYEDARDEGIPFHWLRSPEGFDSRGNLTLRVMELGEKDDSGRRRPVATDEVEMMNVDTVIYAIGDDPDEMLMKEIGLKTNQWGLVITGENGETNIENVYLSGDSRTGASTIVRCIAEGRRTADAITRKDDPQWSRQERLPLVDSRKREEEIQDKKGYIFQKPNARTYSDIIQFGETELTRCLECNYVCNKCVDVCPNRANIALPVGDLSLFNDPYQIIHIDAYCNECGDCGHFCPWEGRPYIDKPTIFSEAEDFENSENPGWLIQGELVKIRFKGSVSLKPLKKGCIVDDSTSDPDKERFYKLFETLLSQRPHLFGTVEPMV
ncbi:putative selenate reductase subunit YgfK [Oceanispirochaeta crateris]|uniref:Putative selenate reductase subunit YgfK n=1 Tax=Oceanispirochaeta crateris TaxID=2518645 RepID=A0A5C1QJ37_9SPIO|nr:putative selenate reductase subunit YgfK [Oceanispirochaeta crateris]QEN06584.1 putative selenate reductase subunit YgfK [Oceanispirochaeta crateris]